MDFKNYLDKTIKKLNREVEKILSKELKEAGGIDKKLVPLLEAFATSCMGGKRIRGVLVRLGYELAGKKSEEILKIGAAYEIFHTAILAHDDIMDQSKTRRGKPSLYKKVGVSEAITLGDLGFFVAMKILAQSNSLSLFAKIASDTAVGQLLDLKKANSITTAKLKTAEYTIAGPMQLGAMLGGSDDKMIKLLGKFGENLGIAFQIKDDILDGQSNRLKQAKEYINLAKKMIPELTKDKRMSKLLAQMAEYLVKRTK